MAPARIIPFDGMHLAAASGLLSRAFNLPAAEARRSLKESMAEGAGSQKIFVAVDDRGLAGIVACHNYTNPAEKEQWASVSRLAVREDLRGQGLGHELMRRAESFIAHEWLKCREGFISLGDSSKSDFYKDQGYVPRPDLARAEKDSPVLVKQLKACP